MELNETFELTEKFRVEEKGDSIRVRFPLMAADSENLNKRTYPLQVLADAVKDLKARVTRRLATYAANQHKDDGMEVDDVSAVLEDVEMSDRMVIAKAKILPTQRGKNIMAILKAGGVLGVSAKGRGEVKEGKVQPGYRLDGFDFTLSPSFRSFVGPNSILESVSIMVDDLDEEIIKKRFEKAWDAGYRGSFEAYRKTYLKENV